MVWSVTSNNLETSCVKRKVRSMKRLILPALFLLTAVAMAQLLSSSGGDKRQNRAVLLIVQMHSGKLTYKLDGKQVETRRDNSLLKTLGEVATQRGAKTPVFIIVDERAPFTEIGKLETALDKIDMPNRRLFVADFPDGTMNELHWDVKPLPIPAE